MFDLTLAQQVALYLSVPTAAFLLYLLFKKSDEDEVVETVTTRQTTIEVQVPQSVVGAVIGRQGATIKEVQSASGARINFKDDDGSGDASGQRIVIIRGTVEAAQHAEILIRKIIQEQPVIVSDEILVPQKCLGRIIGRNGDTIRHIQQASKSKVKVDSSSEQRDPNAMKSISIKGSSDQIEIAKALILEKVAEEEAFRAKQAVSAANRQERGKRGKEGDKPEKLELSTEQQVVPVAPEKPAVDASSKAAVCAQLPTHQDFFEVYVSALDSPAHFWMQRLSSESTQLDKMVTEMTEYYEETAQDPPSNLQIGDTVAAPFDYDSSWYRARVVNLVDSDKVDLYYVDYGDNGILPITKVRALRRDFLNLPFQAFECFLANVKPKGDQWSDESFEVFENLSHAAKWKVVMARIVGYEQCDSDTVPYVELVDTNSTTDVYVADELIRQGYAEKVSATFIPPNAAQSSTTQPRTAPQSTTDSVEPHQVVHAH